MAKGRAGAVCPGLGKTLSSSPVVDISLSTVSVYWFTLFYPNTCAKINWEVLMGLSEGWSLSNIIRQVTWTCLPVTQTRAESSFSLSHSASYRYRCFSFPAGLLQEIHISAVLLMSRRTQGLGKVAHLLKPDLSRHWNREAVDAPSWEVFKDRMDGDLSNLVWWKDVPAHSRSVGIRWSLGSYPSQTLLWFYDILNRMLCLLLAAKGLLMRFSWLSCKAEISDGCAPKPARWLWECQLPSVCLLESPGVRSSRGCSSI